MMPFAVARLKSNDRDPLFASVDSLLHFDGLDTATVFQDIKTKTWNVTSPAQIATAQSVFGGSSGRFTSTARIDAVLGSIGTGDFAVEARVRSDSTAAGYRAVWFNNTAGGIGLYQKAGNFIWYEGGDRCISAAISTNTWYYVAVVRNGGTLSLYVDAVASATTHASTASLATTQYVGSNTANTENFLGYMDELRVTLAARTISSVPTLAFPNS